jgi:hypothetical protein
MDEAWDLTVSVEIGHPLFEAANQQHPAVHFKEIRGRVCSR